MPEYYNDDQYRDVGVLLAEYMLSPEVPVEERERFIDYAILFQKTSALANIEWWDIRRYLLTFEFIGELIKNGYYHEANMRKGRLLFELQLTRSVDGFQTLYGQRGIQSIEYIEQQLKSHKKRGMKEKIRGMIGKKEKRGGGEIIEETEEVTM